MRFRQFLERKNNKLNQTDVFLDMDGVLVDFIGGACKIHKIENPYDKPSNHGKMSIFSVVDMSEAEFWKPLGESFWANLEWHDDGNAILKAIMEYVPESRITLLTAPIKTNTAGCIKGKMDWITKHMPGWTRRFMMGPAKEAIAGLNKILIDDHNDNIDKWASRSGHAIQVPRRWNRCHKEHTLPSIKRQLKRYFEG